MLRVPAGHCLWSLAIGVRVQEIRASLVDVSLKRVIVPHVWQEKRYATSFCSPITSLLQVTVPNSSRIPRRTTKNVLESTAPMPTFRISTDSLLRQHVCVLRKRKMTLYPSILIHCSGFRQ